MKRFLIILFSWTYLTLFAPSDQLNLAIIEGFSLFKDPIVTRTELLLKQPLSQKVADDVLNIIEPDITKNELLNLRKPLTIPQQFAFEMLMAWVLKHCDDIIADPHHAFLKPNGITPLRSLKSAYQSKDQNYPLLNIIMKKYPQNQNSPELKSFEDLKSDPIKYSFAKLYCLASKSQSEDDSKTGYFNIPENFKLNEYIKGKKFDYFFENKDQEELSSEKKLVMAYRRGLNLSILIQKLTYYADKIKEKSSGN